MEENNDEFIPKKRPQILVTIAVSLGMFCSGTGLGWSSPALPSLEDRNDFGYLSTNQRSWIASFYPLGAIFAGPLAGYLMERFGRKKSLMILMLPFAIGWIFIGFAQSLDMIYVGRFITGFCGGCMGVLLPTYISEISHFSIRGSLGTAFNTLNILGVITVTGLGIFLEWDMIALACMAFPLITLICLLFVPESPRYLIAKNELDIALYSLMMLRGTSDPKNVLKEFQEIRTSIEESKENTFKMSELKKRSIRTPIVVSVLINVFQQLSGANAILFYGVDLLTDSGSSVNANVAAVIICAAVVASFVLMDRAGRRPMLFFSEAGMVLSLTGMGVHFYLMKNNDGEVVNGMGWFPIASFILFYCSYAVGMGPIPSIIYSEIIPHHVKGFGTSIVMVVNWFFIFLVTKTFEDLKEAVEEYGFFWFYASLAIPSTLFIYFYIPETKGKTLEEIQKDIYNPADD